jgi:diaminopimelate decarboxylase
LGGERIKRSSGNGAGITFPARVLGLPGVAAAVKNAGHGVDVHSADELTLAVAVGFPCWHIAPRSLGGCSST